MEICELAKMIPQEEVNQKLSYGCSELELDFLGFEDLYRAVSKIVPLDWTIVDLGCYQAAQCYFFRDHEKYIGVDSYDEITSYRYVPPLRFKSENTEHYVCNIERYFRVYDRGKYRDANTYFIASAVPTYPVKDLMDKTENFAWWYPGESVVTGGYKNAEIKQLAEKYLGEK